MSISAALLALSGCGKPLPSGTFRGERAVQVRPGTDPVVAAQMRRVVLRIGPDGRASLEDSGVPWEGQMSRAGDVLRFEVYTVAGINVAKQGSSVPRTVEFAVLPDGSLRYGDARLVGERP